MAEAFGITLGPEATAVGISRNVTLADGSVVRAEGLLGTLAWFADPGPAATGPDEVETDSGDAAESAPAAESDDEGEEGSSSGGISDTMLVAGALLLAVVGLVAGGWSMYPAAQSPRPNTTPTWPPTPTREPGTSDRSWPGPTGRRDRPVRPSRVAPVPAPRPRFRRLATSREVPPAWTPTARCCCPTWRPTVGRRSRLRPTRGPRPPRPRPSAPASNTNSTARPKATSEIFEEEEPVERPEIDLDAVNETLFGNSR
ncbi:MAG: hypothetical protein U5R31_06295 [Acidimicrobiia bacterium]|nr:hypothetical protein [Acidimicrobiia bacterium]